MKKTIVKELFKDESSDCGEIKNYYKSHNLFR